MCHKHNVFMLCYRAESATKVVLPMRLHMLKLKLTFLLFIGYFVTQVVYTVDSVLKQAHNLDKGCFH